MTLSMTGRFGTAVRKIDSVDKFLCAHLNRLSRRGPVRSLFRMVSRLGDGVIWYSMMALLPVIGGKEGLGISLHMALTGIAGFIVYRITKQFSGRERPFISHAEQVTCAMQPLDRYSFPSGHTLHAVSFSLILCRYFPPMAWVLLPFTVLVAMSRMVLGLHYPSDVLAGLVIGAVLAAASFDVFVYPGG